jgi:hypothetical protein
MALTSTYVASQNIIINVLHSVTELCVRHYNSFMICVKTMSLYNRTPVTEMAGRIPDWDRGHNLSRSQSLQNVGRDPGSRR